MICGLLLVLSIHVCVFVHACVCVVVGVCVCSSYVARLLRRTSFIPTT